MKDPQAIMRTARWSELVFAVAALGLAIGLPLPPPDFAGLLVLVHWFGMVVVASGLVVALSRPSRAVWSVALGLSAYFCVNMLATLGARLTTARSFSYSIQGPGVVLSQIVVAVAVLAQLDVALRCWRTRARWTDVSTRPDEASSGARAST